MTEACLLRQYWMYLSRCSSKPSRMERAGYQDLEDIEPITVAAYIEILQRRATPPTVKQHIAAIRMLFSWLTRKRSARHESGPGSQD
jgi:site-specific recombinase XerD